MWMLLESSRPAPRLPGSRLLGHYADLRRDPLALFLRAVRERGDYVQIRFAHIPALIVNDPAGVRAVLHERADNYPREGGSPREMRKFIGDGILTATGESWDRQRAEVQPFLHRGPIEAAFDVTAGELREALAGWAEARDSAGVLDVARAARQVSFQIVCQVLFHYRPTPEEAERFTDAVSFAQEEVMNRLLSVFPPPLFMPTRVNQALRRAMGVAHGLCARIVESGERREQPLGDYLERVLAVSREGGGRPREEALAFARQMMMTLMIVASENPANTVGWALWLLSQRPDILQQVRNEIDRVIGDRAPRLEDLHELTLMKRVLSETLRLYPGGWAMDRQAREEDVLGGYRVPAKSIVFISPYLMHRNPRFWSDPETFEPDRFLPDRASGIPPFAYLPFGAGPHQCLGQKFAYQLMKLFLCEFLRRFDYQLDPAHRPEPQALFTLRPRGGVRLRLIPRA